MTDDPINHPNHYTDSHHGTTKLALASLTALHETLTNERNQQ